MGKLVSKRYLVGAILALVAFGATFYAVFAGFIPVGWSREQPVRFVSVNVEQMKPEAMSIYHREGRVNLLFPGDQLRFTLLQAQPPLDRLVGDTARRNLWVWDDSDIPLRIIERDTEILQGLPGRYDVWVDRGEDRILPGEERQITIELRDLGPEHSGAQFSVVIGALGGREVDPLVSYTDPAVFEAAVQTQTGLGSILVDFQALPQNASSCAVPATFNSFLEFPGFNVEANDGCLETTFDGFTNRLGLSGNAHIQTHGRFGYLLEIDGMVEEGFGIDARDNLSDGAGIEGAGSLVGPVYACFSSGAGIRDIGFGTSLGGPLVLNGVHVSQ